MGAGREREREKERGRAREDRERRRESERARERERERERERGKEKWRTHTMAANSTAALVVGGLSGTEYDNSNYCLFAGRCVKPCYGAPRIPCVM